nr:MAG TPA: hypothetical protein [Caudoviricetes sp.]
MLLSEIQNLEDGGVDLKDYKNSILSPKRKAALLTGRLSLWTFRNFIEGMAMC